MSTCDTPILQNVAKWRNVSRMTPNAAVDAAVSAIDYAIGENVDTLRRRAGMTTAELAKRFRVAPSAMSLKLHGKRAWSALDTQLAARLFGVRMAQLLGEEQLPDPTAPATITDIADLIARRRPVGPAVLETATSTVESGRFAPDWVAPVIPMRRAS